MLRESRELDELVVITGPAMPAINAERLLGDLRELRTFGGSIAHPLGVVRPSYSCVPLPFFRALPSCGAGRRRPRVPFPCQGRQVRAANWAPARGKKVACLPPNTGIRGYRSAFRW